MLDLFPLYPSDAEGLSCRSVATVVILCCTAVDVQLSGFLFSSLILFCKDSSFHLK